MYIKYGVIFLLFYKKFFNNIQCKGTKERGERKGRGQRGEKDTKRENRLFSLESLCFFRCTCINLT